GGRRKTMELKKASKKAGMKKNSKATLATQWKRTMSMIFLYGYQALDNSPTTRSNAYKSLRRSGKAHQAFLFIFAIIIFGMKSNETIADRG
ncbi:hypothetical protein KIN20_018443, partial [Parelaphostrongylus tenuis]